MTRYPITWDVQHDETAMNEDAAQQAAVMAMEDESMRTQMQFDPSSQMSLS